MVTGTVGNWAGDPLNKTKVTDGNPVIVANPVAENGKVAVEKFDQKEPGSYDAILMDIRMPIMDGLEATRRIRNLGKEDSRTISIVALSANAHDEDARKSIANGMNGHLAKPIEVDCLYSMLQQLIM